jgi:hypothetical protein
MGDKLVNYNPYDLVEIILNGSIELARPIEWDTEIADELTNKNAFGNYVKPTKLSTTCPGCGQGLTFTVHLSDPPFEPVQRKCSYCFPAPPSIGDPFCNPLETGRIGYHELDPLLRNSDEPVEGANIIERLDISEEDVEEVKQATQRQVEPELPKAEGLEEEIDFDDSDLEEPE